MPKLYERKHIVSCDVPVTLVWLGSAWHTLGETRTAQPALVPKSAVEAFSRKFPQRAPLQLVKQGGRRLLRRKSEYGKSLRKFYTGLEKAAALRIVHRNVAGCKQVFGELTNQELPHEAALAALGKVLSSPSIAFEGEPAFHNR